MFEFTLACTGKGNYEYLPDAGPNWRAAYDTGFDMEELEATLRLTPEERLEKHQRKLDELLEFETFTKGIRRGWKFIKSHHGNLS